MPFFSPDHANEVAQAQGQGPTPQRPAGLDHPGDQPQPPRPGDAQAGQPQGQPPFSDVPVATQVVDRANVALKNKHGDAEPQKPILDVDNFNAAGTKIGTSHYMYSPMQPNGARLNGYVDKDAQGNIKEFAVRIPQAFSDKTKSPFTVYRATEGHPIDEAKMNKMFQMLSPDLPPDQLAQNMNTLNQYRPFRENLLDNRGEQIVAVRLDPQTGQRFTVRDMRFDPKLLAQPGFDPSRVPLSDGSNPFLCWQAPNGTVYRYPMAKLSNADEADIANAQYHGNMHSSLVLPTLTGKGPQRRAVLPAQVQGQ